MSTASNQSPVDRLKSALAAAGVKSTADLATRITELESQLFKDNSPIPRQVKAPAGANAVERGIADAAYLASLVSAIGGKAGPSVPATVPATDRAGIPANEAAARALLDKYEAMQGVPRSRFFAANTRELFAAAALVDQAAEGADEIKAHASAVKPATPADAAPALTPADARKLLDTYHGLAGKARAAFLREHGAALQSAAALVSEKNPGISLPL